MGSPEGVSPPISRVRSVKEGVSPPTSEVRSVNDAGGFRSSCFFEKAERNMEVLLQNFGIYHVNLDYLRYLLEVDSEVQFSYVKNYAD